MSFQSVVDGNVMAARTLCLLYVAAALGAWWILEQPVNSHAGIAIFSIICQKSKGLET